MGFWGLPEPPAALSGDRSVSDICNSLFGSINDKGNAALVDEFGDIFTENPVETIETGFSVSRTVDMAVQQPVLRFAIPMIPITNQNMPVTHSITNRSDNVIKTKQEIKKHYRKNVAIPRYLEKRQKRKWGKELMHPSRSVAAQRRPRVGGQFGVVDARFTPCKQP